MRLTTYNTPNLPNPAMHAAEDNGIPTISFYAKGVVVPEPGTMSLGLLGLGLWAWLRRRR